MDISNMTYEEFKESRKKVEYVKTDAKCYACGKPHAYWELGDARYFCPGCEECVGLRKDYDFEMRRLGSLQK